MARRLMGTLPLLLTGTALTFGGLTALESPAGAQVTVKCWKEYCVYDPDTRKTYCAREEIPCPEEQT